MPGLLCLSRKLMGGDEQWSKKVIDAFESHSFSG